MRLFVAIPLSAPLLEELTAVSMQLRSNGDGLRWSTPESWHITLQFLGSTSQQQYECIVARLRGLRQPPGTIEMDAIGFFDRAGIFFAGVSLTSELLSLQQGVSAATALCGFIPEAHPYRPHITLARSKGKGGAHDLIKLKAKVHRQAKLTGFVARAFILYESFTRSNGSHYEIRERFPLGGR
jgi:2'-5' RNA ligase